MPAFDHLPAAVFRLLPELETLSWPDEQHADCGDCTMMPQPGRAEPWAFNPATRCCTAHPTLANFLVGRAVRRGEPGRGRVVARLAEPAGVSGWGIDPPPALDRRYRETISHAFGRDVTLRCPYWMDGVYSCAIWHDRNATCRTWYCKHDDGLSGAVRWTRASALLAEVESRLARLCVASGAPPDRDRPAAEVSAADWLAWFTWCAARIDDVTDDELAPLTSDGLRAQRAELVQLRVRPRPPPLADLLVAAISEIGDAGAEVLVTGYSTFDAVRAPRALFRFLARLDGATPWRDALDATRAELAAAAVDAGWLDEALIRELHRVGALRDPAGSDDLPFAVEMVGMDRWSRAAQRVD